MTRTNSLLFLTAGSLLLFSSCVESSFFHVPLQGNTNVYHAIPLASDSLKSATYASGALSIGSMNQNWRDNVFTFQGGLHRSHVIDQFRLNYGASVALGSYQVKPYSNYYYSGNGVYIDSAVRAGAKFFGAYSVYGAISAATRMGRRGEWRYIGVEGSLLNEFGEYYSFRKNLPDSQATEIDKKRYMGAVGINTEVIFKGKSLHEFGIKMALGSYLRRLQHYNPYSPTDSYHNHDDLIYFSNTYHFGYKNSTTYFQFNLATHAAHFQVGYSYRF